MSDETDGTPTGGSPAEHDQDLWTSAEDAGPAAAPSEGAVAGRRGPSRPPRRGGPRRPAAARRSAGSRRGASERSEPVASADDHDDDEYEYEYLGSPSRVPRWVGVVVVLGLLVGGVVGGAYWWYDRQLNPAGSPGETVSVEIPRGTSTSGIGSILDRRGIVPNAMIFNFRASQKGAGPFQAGIYQLRLNSDVDLVLETLGKGPSTPLAANSDAVSVPEGLTVSEMVDRIAQQVPRFTSEALGAALDGNTVASALRPDGQSSYEGLLFPATYQVGAKTEASSLLALMADEMQTRVSGLDPSAAQARIKEQFGVEVSTYDLLIVASLVQAEAGNPDEAPKVAAVIYNRLAKDSTAWTLGIDAVDNYGAAQAGVPVSTFRNTAQPYNTRKVQGLPPTPIAAPGAGALDAAFNPAPGPWLYYVLTEPRVHTFVVTDREFQAAKQICIQKQLGCG